MHEANKSNNDVPEKLPPKKIKELKKKKKKKGFEKICNFTTAYLQASIEISKHGSSCDYYATQLPIHL